MCKAHTTKRQLSAMEVLDKIRDGQRSLALPLRLAEQMSSRHSHACKLIYTLLKQMHMAPGTRLQCPDVSQLCSTCTILCSTTLPCYRYVQARGHHGQGCVQHAAA